MTDASNGNGWQAPGGSRDSRRDQDSRTGVDADAAVPGGPESGPADAPATTPSGPAWAPVAPERPRYGEYGPSPTLPSVPGYANPAPPTPGYSTPGYGAPGYGAPPQVQPPLGWTPPPKPGLVPLRPLGFGTLLGAPFRYLRGSRGVLGISLLLQIGLLLILAVIGSAVFFGGFNRITDYADPDQSPLIAGSIAASVLAGIGYFALNLVVSAFIQGIVVVDMSLAVLGQKQTVKQLWQRVKPSLGALMRWTLLLTLAVLVAVLILAGIVLIGVAIGGVGLAISIGVTILLALGAVVLGAWLVTKFSITPSIIVLERSKAIPAARRSWSLTTGFFWRTLGCEALVAVIIQIAAQIISVPLSLLQFVGVIIDPNMSSGAGFAVLIVVYVLSAVVSLLIGTVGALVQAALVALIYIDLRMRKEGLDLVLQKHIESASSTSDAADPYAPLQREFA